MEKYGMTTQFKRLSEKTNKECSLTCSRFLTPLRCVRNDNRATGVSSSGGDTRAEVFDRQYRRRRSEHSEESHPQRPSFRRSEATEETRSLRHPSASFRRSEATEETRSSLTNFCDAPSQTLVMYMSFFYRFFAEQFNQLKIKN